jgi:hypothetical protein
VSDVARSVQFAVALASQNLTAARDSWDDVTIAAGPPSLPAQAARPNEVRTATRNDLPWLDIELSRAGEGRTLARTNAAGTIGHRALEFPVAPRCPGHSCQGTRKIRGEPDIALAGTSPGRQNTRVSGKRPVTVVTE